MTNPSPVLILASGSVARQDMLKNAGLEFETAPVDLDEGAIIDLMQERGAGVSEIASELAQKKALAMAKDNPEALVIGSDQILEFEGEILSKAENAQDARQKLGRLNGKTHKLISAVSVAKAGTILWKHVDEAALSMHEFDKEFLDQYCARAGVALTRAVGAYELESHGSWLFSKIEGNYFTILGMPLLPLLNYLHEYHGAKP